jgi:hypothetical protein
MSARAFEFLREARRNPMDYLPKVAQTDGQ